MAVISIPLLKSYFETGDFPTQSQFVDLIDTLAALPATIVDGSGTANEITYWVDSDTIGSLATATYPSLTELAFVKGVTSSIQTQLNNRFTQGGNSFGATARLGTNDAFALEFETNNTLAGTISSAQLWSIGSSAPVAGTRLLVTGTGTTSATFALKVDNSTPSPCLYVRNDRKVSIATSTFNGILTIDNASDANSAVLWLEFQGGLGGFIIANRSAVTDDNFGTIWETAGAPKWFTGMVANSENYYFRQNTSSGTKILSIIQSNGNIGMGGDTFGTNANTVFGIVNGIAPIDSPPDMIQMYSADQAAGNAAPHFRTELGDIIKLYKQTLTNSTGGVADGDLIDVATLGVADPAKINNNFTEIYTIFNNLGLR